MFRNVPHFRLFDLHPKKDPVGINVLWGCVALPEAAYWCLGGKRERDYGYSNGGMYGNYLPKT